METHTIHLPSNMNLNRGAAFIRPQYSHSDVTVYDAQGKVIRVDSLVGRKLPTIGGKREKKAQFHR